MNRTYLILFAVASFLGLYFHITGFLTKTTKSTIKISLTNKEQVVKIPISKYSRDPFKYRLEIDGWVDQEGEFKVGWDDTTYYKTKSVSGEFDLKFGGDWYADTVFVTFDPIHTTRGKAKIDCEIYGTKKHSLFY